MPFGGKCKDHGRPSVNGYAQSGQRVRKGLPSALHRYLFLLEHGYLPEVVMHTCDNPRCINLRHLKAGTWDLNNKDRAKKGRSAKSIPSRRKVTQNQARQIRHRYARSKPKYDRVNGVNAIARDYGVDQNTIYNIVENRTHVEP